MATLHPLETNFSTGLVVPYGTLAVLVVGALGTILWVWMLIDALRRPSAAWRDADRSQVAWVLVLIFLGWIGALLYLAIARPSIRRAGSERRCTPAV